MGRPKRDILAAVAESATPPDALTPTQSVARVVRAEGNSLYMCELPSKKAALVELQSRFRNTVWIKRGGYVLIDVASAGDSSNSRVVGEIINVVRDEREWRKQPYWCGIAPLDDWESSPADVFVPKGRRSLQSTLSKTKTRRIRTSARCRPATRTTSLIDSRAGPKSNWL